MSEYAAVQLTVLQGSHSTRTRGVPGSKKPLPCPPQAPREGLSAQRIWLEDMEGTSQIIDIDDFQSRHYKEVGGKLSTLYYYSALYCFTYRNDLSWSSQS